MPVIDEEPRARDTSPKGGEAVEASKPGGRKVLGMVLVVVAALVVAVILFWPAIKRVVPWPKSTVGEAASAASGAASATLTTKAPTGKPTMEAAQQRAILECLVEVVTARTMLDQDKKNRDRAVEISAQAAVFDGLVAKAEQNLSRHADLCAEILASFQSAYGGDPRGFDDQINKLQIALAPRHQEEAALFRQSMDAARRAKPGSEAAVLKAQLLGAK